MSYTENAKTLKENIEASLTGIAENKTELEKLRAENALLNEELISTQLALCDVYEMLIPTE